MGGSRWDSYSFLRYIVGNSKPFSNFMGNLSSGIVAKNPAMFGLEPEGSDEDRFTAYDRHGV